ncbi:carboxymuconolactone decarboxylase family protein [Mycobacterium vicinigordonae]|uniref:Carboxymuconolactone decarboxylase family protein n=2 Tax=Mycobacterium vicinigordonae TaxID=1719132 RepID=A0A7D6ICN3_9MYCO|nr:carboxymuconolactone decarboxylase family protein [Mycobacterium vicinigordonae]
MVPPREPLPYPDIDVLPPHLQDAVTSRASLNIFRMIMHTPALAPSFLTLANDVLQQNSLPPTWRELVILRVGFRYHCGYELHHHLNIGRAIGVTEADIAAAESGSTESLGEEEANILRLADLILTNHTLSAAERTAALKTLSINQLADLTLTVGFYQLVCNFLNIFGVQPEGSPQ